ncbi:Uncharacterised protein [Paenibacillus macerans]|uniref:Uncharacterized protein n=1 Tax=Paenibacillus macerans TaxID=44252 RepID=A0A090Z5Y9_PAEMA|nr:hypothetical protein DJ90_359 [Paenibacillus macerans]GBK65749.1 hypothetical protein PbDSM24746_57530 [Paenibacillus macerans]GBK71976.1 hypothetical protein PbJCM17693_56840 [Paenibacillus macerans]SUA85580.1 Uncharacterised protein [Paenibacillus macerans]
MDPAGRSLISNEEGAWQEEWIVIGHTLLTGDPIIVDLGEAGHPVSYLMHGMGEWGAGSYIAGSMQHLRDIFKKANKWMSGQSRPQTNRNLPVTCAELDALVAEIAEMDYADAETWKMLLDPAYESAKAYEEEMIRQIRAMNEQGTQLDWTRPKETSGRHSDAAEPRMLRALPGFARSCDFRSICRSYLFAYCQSPERFGRDGGAA